VFFAEIDSGDIVSLCPIFGFNLVRGPDFISVFPSDLDEDRLLVDRLVDKNWVIAPTV